MKKKSSLLAILFFFSCMLIMAQEWTKEDSIWLQNVLEGKEELKINEDTKKAIEEGRLILPSWMRSDNNQSTPELLMDFDDVGIPDDSLRFGNFDPLTMPRAVLALYVLYLDKMDSILNISRLMMTDEVRKELESLIPTGAFIPYTSDLNSGFSLSNRDFNHALSMVFSAHYRRLMHNRKNATAYKNYYDDGMVPGRIRFSEQDRMQLNKIVTNKKVSFKVNFGSKVNGIDD